MLATGVQWYWTDSSSCDIQSIADMGALAGADAIAKTATVIQILDLTLLSLNVVALLLHVVVIVSGVVMVTAAPAGGSGMAPLFQKAVEFDKKFIDLRKKFADGAFQVATFLSNAAPYLAMGQSYRVIWQSSRVQGGFNRTSFSGTAVPFPLKGEVTLSSMPSNETDLASLAGETAGSNRDDAEAMTTLEGELEAARIRCWERDSYRPQGAMPYGWAPAAAVDDFAGQLARLGGVAPDVALPASATGSDSSDAVLAERYREDFAAIGCNLSSRFDALTADSADGFLNPVTTTAESLLASEYDAAVFLVDHDDAERRAYHSSLSCVGLSSAASTPGEYRLAVVVGDDNHPPCSLCTPVHWAAVTSWAVELDTYIPRWNEEALAIQEYEDVRRQLMQLQGELAGRTSSVLTTLLESVESYLRGGRLTYRPAGSRGILCVVASTTTRTMPSFTLPGMTGSGERVMGRQVAMAGAAVSTTSSGSAVSDAMTRISSYAQQNRGTGLSGALLSTCGLAEGVSAPVVSLWQSGLSVLRGSSIQASAHFEGVPWGLDGLIRGFTQEFARMAGTSKPDLRQAIPVLVSVAAVGDPSAEGIEGSFARAVGSARSSYAVAHPSGDLAGLIGDAASELAGDYCDQLLSVTRHKLLGKLIALPFDEYSTSFGMDAVLYSSGGLQASLVGAR